MTTAFPAVTDNRLGPWLDDALNGVPHARIAVLGTMDGLVLARSQQSAAETATLVVAPNGEEHQVLVRLNGMVDGQPLLELQEPGRPLPAERFQSSRVLLRRFVVGLGVDPIPHRERESALDQVDVAVIGEDFLGLR